MSEQKGKHGGARANSGGARPGAGRPPRPPAATDTSDPTAFLVSVMVGAVLPSPAQLTAAIALARLKAAPVGDKKARATEASATVATGRFATRPPPPRLLGKD